MTTEEQGRSAPCSPPAEEGPVPVAAVDREAEEEEEEEDSSDDLEFSFAIRNPDELLPTVTADELFSDGRILPAYPVFNRDMSPFRSQNPAKGAEDLQIPLGRLSIDARTQAAHEEREAAGECCESTPGSAALQSPGRCKKSASTGRTRTWRLRDLVVGRSRSDGNERFSFIETNQSRRPSTLSSSAAASAKEKLGAGDRGAQRPAAGKRVIDTATANRAYYGGIGKGSSSKQGMTRRSFLPYRRELVGLFAPINGLNW